MFRRFSTICFSVLIAMLFAVPAFSQNDTSIQFGKPQPKEDLPTNIKETLAKQRIAREKKDYQELLDRSQEAVKLSEELEKSFVTTNKLSVDDEKKLDRLEKLVKKIRSELGADSDDGEENIDDQDNAGKSSTMVNSLKTLQSKSSQLFDEIKKQTRYSVSVIAIQTSNTLLRIVKYIRFGK